MERCLLLHRISFSAFAVRRAFVSTAAAASSSSSPARPPPSASHRAAPAVAFDTTLLRPSSRSFSSRWPNYRSCIVHIDARVLLRTMQQREWDAALERELTHAGVALTPHIVDQVVACIPGAKLALQFFIWAGEQIGYPPATSKASYSITEWFARKSQIVSFLNILRCLEGRRFYLSPSRVNVLLQGYGWAGMLDRAYNVMRQEQGFSNDMLVNCFLFAIMRQYRFEMVYDVYLEMKKRGTALDLCYDALVQGMCAAGGERWQEAHHLYKKMVDTGQVPNEATCNTLVLSISKAGEHERAYELLQYMIQKKISLENVTLSAVVECLCRAKQLPRASMLIEQGRQSGCTLDPGTWSV